MEYFSRLNIRILCKELEDYFNTLNTDCDVTIKMSLRDVQVTLKVNITSKYGFSMQDKVKVERTLFGKLYFRRLCSRLYYDILDMLTLASIYKYKTIAKDNKQIALFVEGARG
jgi:hypothetical protein